MKKRRIRCLPLNASFIGIGQGIGPSLHLVIIQLLYRFNSNHRKLDSVFLTIKKHLSKLKIINRKLSNLSGEKSGTEKVRFQTFVCSQYEVIENCFSTIKIAVHQNRCQAVFV